MNATTLGKFIDKNSYVVFEKKPNATVYTLDAGKWSIQGSRKELNELFVDFIGEIAKRKRKQLIGTDEYVLLSDIMNAAKEFGVTFSGKE